MATDDAEVYVHALAERGLPRTVRILGHTLHALPMGKVDAVVERHHLPMDPTTEALEEQHAIIVRLADRGPALLPARFGSRSSESALRRTVLRRESEILESLARVRGCRQMTIRVFGEADPEGPVAQRVQSGTAFLKSRQARAHYQPPEVALIRDALGSLVAAERVESGQRGLRVTIFHLVATTDLDAYRTCVASLRLDPYQVMVSGPFPAFAFTPELL
jgi:Gas vesicle synthesis protein GvpL/GvpF